VLAALHGIGVKHIWPGKVHTHESASYLNATKRLPR